MPTYLIEREIPGADKLTDEELRGITAKSNDERGGLVLLSGEAGVGKTSLAEQVLGDAPGCAPTA